VDFSSGVCAPLHFPGGRMTSTEFRRFLKTDFLFHLVLV
jgi:hypothetical protein